MLNARSVQNDEMLVIGCTAPFHTLVLAHGPLRGLVLNCLSRFGVRKPYERPSAISTARRCMCHRRRCILKRSAHSRDSTNPILRLCAVAVTGRVIARTDCGRWRSCWSTTTVDQALHCRGDMSNIQAPGRPPPQFPRRQHAPGRCVQCRGALQEVVQHVCIAPTSSAAAACRALRRWIVRMDIVPHVSAADAGHSAGG